MTRIRTIGWILLFLVTMWGMSCLYKKCINIALFCEIESGKISTVKILLNLVNINVKSESGHTPLTYASFKGQADIVQLLLEKGADVTSKGELGRTALHFAAASGNKQIAEMLLNKGANVNNKDADGKTPLILATSLGREEVIDILLEKGADINAKDEVGNTAFIYAITPNQTSSKQVNIVKKLLKKDISIDKKDMGLLLRLVLRKIEILELLLTTGADVNAKDAYGQTALMKATKIPEAIQVLLRAGADVNAKDIDDKTALLIATENYSLEAIKALINAGADVDAKSKNGTTALMIARKEGRIDIVELLTKARAKQ